MIITGDTLFTPGECGGGQARIAWHGLVGDTHRPSTKEKSKGKSRSGKRLNHPSLVGTVKERLAVLGVSASPLGVV